MKTKTKLSDYCWALASAALQFYIVSGVHPILSVILTTLVTLGFLMSATSLVVIFSPEILEKVQQNRAARGATNLPIVFDMIVCTWSICVYFHFGWTVTGFIYAASAMILTYLRFKVDGK